MVLASLTGSTVSREFIGREDILEEIYKTIDDGAPAVIVKGPGGSGKTALLRRVAVHLSKKQPTNDRLLPAFLRTSTDGPSIVTPPPS